MRSSRPPVGERRRRAWALLRTLLRQQRRVLAGAVLGGISWQLAGIVVPVIIGWTVDRGIVADDRSAIWWGGLALVVLGGFEAAGAALRHRMACTAYVRSSASLREELTAAALGLGGEERVRFPPGEVLARETSDTDTVGGLMDAVGHTVAESLSIPIIVVALFVIDPLIALTVAVTVPATALVMWRYSVVWDRRSAAAQAAMGATVERAQESVEGFKVLRGIGAEEAAVARFAERSGDLRDRATDVGRLWLVFEPLLDSLSVLSVAAVLWVGGNRVVDDEVALGGVVTAIGFVLFLSGPVRTVGERILTLQTALASADRIVELLDAAPPLDPAGADPLAGTDGLPLEVHGVTVDRPGGGGQPLVAIDEFEVGPGSLVVLEGATGSGKTTLLAVLAGLRPPSAGEVSLGGVALAAWPVGALRQRIVVCGPAPFLFAGSIAENLRFADRCASDDDLWRALEVAACRDVVDDLPGRLGAELGERGVSLSGGQRQRLALARSVLAHPAVLVVDGGTAALDPATEIRVLRGIRAALPSTAIVVVSANPALRADADQVLTIDGAQLQVSPS
jgi:ABC-type multidrug transport system fused ATPase/permease subunit